MVVRGRDNSERRAAIVRGGRDWGISERVDGGGANWGRKDGEGGICGCLATGLRWTDNGGWTWEAVGGADGLPA